MGERKATSWFVIASVSLCMAACCMLLVGCGDNSPEGAVQSYLGALENSNWEAYKSALNPEIEFTREQEELMKQKFNQLKVEVKDVKADTEYSEDKKQATVTLVSGDISYTLNVLGNEKTDTQDIDEMKPEDKPQIMTVMVEDTWYVDPTASWPVL